MLHVISSMFKGTVPHHEPKETEDGKTTDKQSTRRHKKSKSKSTGSLQSASVGNDGRVRGGAEETPSEGISRSNIAIPKQSNAIAVQGALRSHRCR